MNVNNDFPTSQGFGVELPKALGSRGNPVANATPENPFLQIFITAVSL